MDEPFKKRVTPATVLEIAAIAGLDLDATRAAELAPLLQGLLDGIDSLSELDLADVEPAPISPIGLE